MADESQPPSEPAPKPQNRITRHVPMFAKLLQIILSIFAIGLLVDPLNSFQQIFNKPRFRMDDAAIIYISIAGYVLINSLFIVSHVLGDRIPKRTLILFASMGALLHVVAGSVVVHNWRKLNGPYHYIQNNEIYPSKQYMDMLISAAVFTFVNAALFVAEVFLIIRFGTKTNANA